MGLKDSVGAKARQGKYSLRMGLEGTWTKRSQGEGERVKRWPLTSQEHSWNLSVWNCTFFYLSLEEAIAGHHLQPGLCYWVEDPTAQASEFLPSTVKVLLVQPPAPHSHSTILIVHPADLGEIPGFFLNVWKGKPNNDSEAKTSELFSMEQFKWRDHSMLLTGL